MLPIIYQTKGAKQQQQHSHFLEEVSIRDNLEFLQNQVNATFDEVVFVVLHYSVQPPNVS